MAGPCEDLGTRSVVAKVGAGPGVECVSGSEALVEQLLLSVATAVETTEPSTRSNHPNREVRSGRRFSFGTSGFQDARELAILATPSLPSDERENRGVHQCLITIGWFPAPDLWIQNEHHNQCCLEPSAAQGSKRRYLGWAGASMHQSEYCTSRSCGRVLGQSYCHSKSLTRHSAQPPDPLLVYSF